MFGIEIFHRIRIRNHIAPEAHFSPQPLAEPVGTALDRDAVVVIVGAHYAHQPSLLNHSSERVGVNHLHLPRRNLRVGTGKALARALVGAVCKEMLRRGGSTAIRLNAPCHLNAKLGNEIRRFSVGLLEAAPSLVSCHIQDGSIDIGIAQGSCLLAGHRSHLPYKFPVPTVPEPELGGEVGRTQAFHSSYSLIGKICGDAESGLLYKETLHLVHSPTVLGRRPYILIVRRWKPPVAEAVEVLVNGANPVFPKPLLPLFSRKVVLENAPVAVEGNHLAGLLFQGHTGE